MRIIFGAAMLAAISPASAFEPANQSGGWDFTCRWVGKVLFDLKKTASPVQVTNKASGGGAVAFAEVVAKRNDENNLIIAASTATTTRLAQGKFAGFTANQVRWLGTGRRRLRGDRRCPGQTA